MGERPIGKKFWGKHWWFVLHSSAVCYNPSKSKGFLDLLRSYSVLMPCDYCCRHFITNLTKLPVEKFMANNHQLFLWTYLIHDSVNKEHTKHNPKDPKISPPFEEVKKFYFSGLGER